MSCEKCGSCCKLFNTMSLLDNEDIQKYNRGDGICIYLENNLCKIYQNRPVFCNRDKLYQQNYSQIYTTEEYNEIINESCQNIKNMKRI